MLEFGNPVTILDLEHGSLSSTYMLEFGIPSTYSHYRFSYIYGLILRIYTASPLFMILLDFPSLLRRNRAFCFSCFVFSLIIALLTLNSSHIIILLIGLIIFGCILISFIITSPSWYCLDSRHLLIYACFQLFTKSHISCMQGAKYNNRKLIILLTFTLELLLPPISIVILYIGLIGHFPAWFNIPDWAISSPLGLILVRIYLPTFDPLWPLKTTCC